MTDFYMKYDAGVKWVNFTTSPKRKRQTQLDHSGANTGFEGSKQVHGYNDCQNCLITASSTVDGTENL